jgi:SAM-dependent methyltransferase
VTRWLRVEKERVSSTVRLPPWTRNEHFARYEFAAKHARGREVIDCACGDGTCSRLMAESGAREVRGFDLSRMAISEANASNRLRNVVFAVAGAGSLPVPSDSADMFVSLETIEHLADDRGFLAEVVRTLRPTGLFICSTPDRDVYSPGHDLSSRPWNSFHVREYSQVEFAGLLRSHFAEVTLFGQNRKSASVTALKCRLGQRLPSDLVVRLNQVGKLPRFIYDTVERHRVEPAREQSRYEFLVAVCLGPRA